LVVEVYLRRVKTLIDALARTSRWCTDAAKKGGLGRKPSDKNLQVAWGTLRSAIRSFDRLVRHGPVARIRHSCSILAQVYIAFSDPEDTDWLGLSPDVLADGRALVGHESRGWKNHVFFEQVNAALGDLDVLYRGHPPLDSEVDETIAGGGLVLTEGPAAYWQGEEIKVDWRKNNRPWELLVALVEAGPFGEVDQFRMFKGRVGNSALPNIVNRLKTILPSTLRTHIGPCGQGRYRLRLQDHPPVSFYES
jgi:hypothetical protein